MKSKSAFMIAILAALCFVSACSGGGSATPAAKPSNSSVTAGVMTTSVDNDSMPTSPVRTSFAPDTKAIYCSFKVSGVAPQDMIKASWYYLKGEAVGKENTLINETYTVVQSDSSSYYLAFYLDAPNAGSWDKGDYKVVISVNGVEKLSIPFTVE
ncbi:MAG: hypothetical protein ABSB31_06490 [Dehalococcoidia bacterium]|jgi:hypothetical protein